MRTKLAAILMAAVLATAALGLTACEKKGPAEKAGDKIDKAVEKVGDAIDPKGPAEKAGRKIDKALDNDN
jgi:hypothetical protein